MIRPRQFGAILVVLSLLMCAFPMGVFASTGTSTTEKPQLTFEQRVQNLKIYYNVDYSTLGYANASSDPNALISLTAAEAALQRLGQSTFSTIRSKMSTFKIINYSASYYDDDYFPMGSYDYGRVRFRYSEGSYADGKHQSKEQFQLTLQNFQYQGKELWQEWLVMHEIMHAYDNDFLGHGGRQIVINFKNKYGIKDVGGQYKALMDGNNDYRIRLGYNVKSAQEDFVEIAAQMLLSEKKITELLMETVAWEYRNVQKTDLIYLVSLDIYNQMLKDFGPESNAVKRAAWFLDIEGEETVKIPAA